MKRMGARALAFALLAVLWGPEAALAAAGPKVKMLSVAEDATKKTVLVGRAMAEGMIIQFELEPAKGMWMPMGNPPMWMEHKVGAGELFHVEVKPIDPKSKTRVSYADVKFSAVNRGSGKKTEIGLHPMWGGSGLHYAANSGLSGDGTYEATVTVGVPAFARDPKQKDLWNRPATAKFHFKLAGGKLTEVSEPAN